MAQCLGSRAQMVRLFFLVFTCIWQEDFAKNLRSAWDPTQYKSSLVNNVVSKRNHLLYFCTIFSNNSPPPIGVASRSPNGPPPLFN